MPNWVTTIAYMGACRKRIGGCRAILVCTEKRRVCERSTLVQVITADPMMAVPMVAAPMIAVQMMAVPMMAVSMMAVPNHIDLSAT